ncbi:helix-turn-helix transcriptional regulator [Marimonas arenosa]|uniref:Helix-turn-helix transcriptional regulator n=1 Tax=Marimonas arenosa TaxID=1795305 RepID=A0AAE3WD03_9RHOB|nr:helix-turn-helix transcriptional regulator [Marimonas arenosa]MDQ2089395.1 helix-turn-helix transcriptional regulator [Marimonas arenosa]
MHRDEDAGQPLFLTTREVAEMLRIKERKVYDLVAAGEIPFRRMTGKLLFPRADILAWIGEAPAAPTAERPAVLTGSHDPLLDWAVRESGAGLATLWNGSLDGLERFAAAEAALAGLHVPEEDSWNIATVAARGLRDCVLIGWAKRTRGLLVSAQERDRIGAIQDLKGKRVALRQPGAGAAVLFDQLLRQADLKRDHIHAVDSIARTETDAAAAIAAGEADAALGLEAMARQFHLGFLPLLEERFDLLIDRRAYFTEAVQKLMGFSRSEALHAKAELLGGYNLACLGRVQWLSP